MGMPANKIISPIVDIVSPPPRRLPQRDVPLFTCSQLCDALDRSFSTCRFMSFAIEMAALVDPCMMCAIAWCTPKRPGGDTSGGAGIDAGSRPAIPHMEVYKLWDCWPRWGAQS